MKIAIDKNIDIEKLNKDNDYIYVFDDKEKVSDLINTGLYCINKDLIKYVDINMTQYNINCIKKAKITDKDYDKIPEKEDYKFAIIVPNCNNDHGDYKGKTFFENCIESILNQTYKNFELIIVDDMSSDTSVETAKEYQKKDKRIHIIENIRKRYNGGSRNVGIEYAIKNLDFDYFCFLDSDDWWVDNEVLETINKELYNHELMLIGLELIDKSGVYMTKIHECDDYKDFFLSDNKVWCTAWARVIRKDKIVYFCEDTLMEDRVWSYKQADNVEYDNIKILDKVCYVWNRMNTNNSVSQVRGNYWDASAWCHIGHQIQMLPTLKHKEIKPILEKRIKDCIKLVNNGTFTQY
jgi:glycosyltransferase involved in cell wall biosynthesis